MTATLLARWNPNMRNPCAGYPLFALLLLGTLPAQDLYDIPTVRSFYITTHQNDWWTRLAANRRTKTDLNVDLTVDNKTYKGVGLRFRGNSSYLATGNSQKKSFNVTLDAFTVGQDLLGYTNLNLSNAYNDPTFTREVVSYELLRRYMPAPKANYIRLYINNVSWGIYINVQQPDKEMMSEWFKGNDGNRYRCDPPQSSGNGRSALQWLGNDLNLYKAAYDLKTENSPTGWLDIRNACDVLNNTATSQLPQALPKVIDVDRALWYFALNSILVNLDSYIGRGNDYYLYHDEEHDQLEMMPWDMNESFGGSNASMSVAQLKVLDIFWQANNTTSRPLLARMLANAAWRTRYVAHYRTLLDEVYDWNWIGSRVTKYQAMIEKDVQADTKKLYPTYMFKGNLTTDYRLNSSFFRTWAPGLKPFVDARRTYLLARSDIKQVTPVLSQLARSPADPTDNQPVWITARVTGATSVTLHTRVTGPFSQVTMFDDGKHGDGAPNDGVYGGRIAGQPSGTKVDYYVGAASTGGLRFLPRNAGHKPEDYRVDWPRGSSPVRLNELLARNNTGIVDEKGQHEDWFELFNSGTKEADLSGHYVTDNLSNSKQWTIPAGTKLQPGKSLIIWADNDAADGPLHANFKLDAGGEELALFAADGRTLLDHEKFGAQEADVSTGRLFDGKRGWVGYPTPSPRMLNAPATCGVRLYTAVEPLTHSVTQTVSGSAKIATTATFQISTAPANSAVAELIGSGGTALPLPEFRLTLLVNPLLAVVVLPTDATGQARFLLPIPDDAALVGARLYVQAIGIQGGGLIASNAAETTFCPK